MLRDQLVAEAKAAQAALDPAVQAALHPADLKIDVALEEMRAATAADTAGCNADVAADKAAQVNCCGFILIKMNLFECI
jgi:hypothetical protein